MVKIGDYLYCHKEMTSTFKKTSEPSYTVLLKKGNSYRVEACCYFNKTLCIVNEKGNEHVFPIGDRERIREGHHIEDYFTYIGNAELLDIEKVFKEL